MDKKSDIELAGNVKSSNCETSLQELIIRHSPLCFRIYAKYNAALKEHGFTHYDFKTEKDFIIYSAAMSFEPSKAKFDTWVGNMVCYFCLNKLRSSKNTLVLENNDLFKIIDDSYECTAPNIELREYILNKLEELKNSKVKEIYRMRYFENPSKNVSWKDIAKRLNLSIQGVINLHESAQRTLKARLKNKELADIL